LPLRGLTVTLEFTAPHDVFTDALLADARELAFCVGFTLSGEMPRASLDGCASPGIQ